MTDAATGSLTASDLERFARIGIGAELLAEARVRRVTDSEARNDFGIKGSPTMDMSGIVFPYFIPAVDYRVTARLRRDNPEVDENGKPKGKYISPFGDGRHLYFPPYAAEKLKQREAPIVLVEAEKSVLALTAWAQRVKMNLLPLGLGGCWGWRGHIGKVENARGERVDQLGPLPDLSYCDGRKVYVLLDSNVATNPKVRQARAALVAELRRRGCEVLICDLPIVEGVNGPDDFIAVRGDDAMAEVFASASKDVDRPAEFSDDALGLKFTELHGNDLRYTAPWRRWSLWNGTCWRTDETLDASYLARTVCRAAAAGVENQKMAPRIASAQTIAAVERLARADRRHAATVDQWDADPWLLNSPGGVVDLRTGKLRPAARENFLTKMTSVAPGGNCPQWQKFLSEITGNDKELQSYLQRMMGYALTGSTEEHALFFLYGTGANGKSVFLETLFSIMGDYARVVPMEALIDLRNEQHSTNVAGLVGTRLAAANETEEGRRWNESKIKALTGGDMITARFMRQDFFDFRPQFKLIVRGNRKPSLRSIDEGMKRRMNLVPFRVTIPKEKRDPKLPEKLREEWGGILQWMIEGCLAWHAHGLQAPKVVSEATANYLACEDVLAHWIEERCDVKDSLWTSSTALYANWRQWAEANGEFVGSQKQLSQNLESRGFVPKPTRAARGFLGIGLVTDVTDRPH